MLQERIVRLLTRPVARPPKRPQMFFASFTYQAQSRASRSAALRWTRLSCRTFRANAVRLQLVVLADELVNFLCALALPDEAAQRTLITLREKLIRIGARIVPHRRDVVFQLAEMEAPQALSTTLLRRIARLRGPPVPAT